METNLNLESHELKAIIKEALKEHDYEQALEHGVKLYNVNQVARRLGKAHATIKKMISNGIIRTTKDGLISEASISEYLKG